MLDLKCLKRKHNPRIFKYIRNNLKFSFRKITIK